MIIVGIIIAIILWNISDAIMHLAEVLKPIAEYYYKKQRNQLPKGSDDNVRKNDNK